MIASTGVCGRQVARGIEDDVRSFSGAVAVRVIEGGGSIVDEHRHDWPVLSLYVMGNVLKVQDGGEVRVDRPAVVFHGAGEPHANAIGSRGLEQLDIQFDPQWLARSPNGMIRNVRVWRGGAVAAEATLLRHKWTDKRNSEAELADATARFIERAFASGEVREPRWLATALERVAGGEVTSTQELARELDMHPGWLAQAYRAAVGEGLPQSAQRHRVERATELLRTTGLNAAAIAADAGFCDQSHMIRAFRRLLRRTPSRVRAERDRLPVGLPARAA